MTYGDRQTLEVCRKIRNACCSDPPRVAFLIYTYANNHKTRCGAQYATWGRRAPGLLYFSNAADELLPIVSLGFEGPESYDNMWRKTTAMLRYAYLRLRRRFDWFMVGGDDLYVILNNIHAYLSSSAIRDANTAGQPLYLGRRFRQPSEDFSFNSGGAGYLLNRAALEAFVETVPEYADIDSSAEDVMVGRALHLAGIQPFDTRDEHGAERFHPFTPRLHCDYRIGAFGEEDWFAEYTRDFGLIEGIAGISPESVTFHYVDESLMHVLDKLLGGESK